MPGAWIHCIFSFRFGNGWSNGVLLIGNTTGFGKRNLDIFIYRNHGYSNWRYEKMYIYSMKLPPKTMSQSLSLPLFFLLALIACQPAPSSISLFNGKDLTGWHVDVPDMDSLDVINPFIVREGMLVSLGTPNGHLITDSVFKDYRLEIEYRFAAEPGNCGILVHASTPRALYSMFPKSVEVQMFHENAGDFWCIVEDISVPDMETRRGPKEEWGITEGKQRRILNLTDGSEKPAGEWNAMKIECLRTDVKVWVNGDLVNWGHECTASQGQIAFQAEGSEVEVRKMILTPIQTLSE